MMLLAVRVISSYIEYASAAFNPIVMLHEGLSFKRERIHKRRSSNLPTLGNLPLLHYTAWFYLQTEILEQQTAQHVHAA